MKLLQADYSRVSNRRDSPFLIITNLINLIITNTVFCHPPQPYSALHVY